MHTAATVSAAMAQQAERICRELLPAGKTQGAQYQAGDTGGNPGQSLHVCLRGDKSGVWKDFATDQHGDLLDLWAAVRGVDLGQAIEQAKAFLGIEDVKFHPRAKTKQFRRPERPENVRRPKSDDSGVLAYLTEERKLSEEVIAKYRIGAQQGSPSMIVFPYLRDGEIVNIKYLGLQRTADGKKITRLESGAELCLFGWQTIPPTARAVAITEGECLTGDAEVFTRHGWTRFDEYQGEPLLQVSPDGSARYVTPQAIIRKPFSGVLKAVAVRGYEALVTPKHNLVALDQHGQMYKHTADQGPIHKGHRIPRVCELDGNGIDLSDAQIQFCLAISADAAIDQRKNGNRYARISFKKARKIDLFMTLLDLCGVEYIKTVQDARPDMTFFGVQLPNWVPGRILPVEWLTLASSAQRRMILDSLPDWDGNYVPDRNQTEYSSKLKANADWVQAMAHTSGRCSSIIKRSNEFGQWYKVSILHGKTSSSWQTTTVSDVDYTGMVYCVQVDSGMFLSRYHDKVSVTGNCDAMTLAMMGVHALSVPNGANGQTWIENEFDRLARFDQIFVAMDNDEPGCKAAMELIERLGRHRCRYVRWPEGVKDANDALQQGWTQKEFAACIMGAKTLDPIELKNAGEFVDDVIRLFYPSEGAVIGLPTPWEKTGDDLLFRPGESSLWAGINGHGKSMMLNQIAIEGIARGERFCIASMEMPARSTLHRMVRQVTGLSQPSVSFIRTAHAWLSEGLWLFDLLGTAKVDRMLEVFQYARMRYNVTHFVVDSIAKCGIAEDDYRAQKQLVERLVDFAHEYNAHVHIVAHPRKGQDEYIAPGKMDVKGTGALTDMVDNVLVVWKNKRKTDQREELPPGEVLPADVEDLPDNALYCVKQRHTGWEGKVWLWFDPESLQFLGSKHHSPRLYVQYSDAGEEHG